MIHKLESAGLGYHVATQQTHDRLGMSWTRFLTLLCIKRELVGIAFFLWWEKARVQLLLRFFMCCLVLLNIRSHSFATPGVQSACAAWKHAAISMGLWPAKSWHWRAVHTSNCQQICKLTLSATVLYLMRYCITEKPTSNFRQLPKRFVNVFALSQ